jgi:hypothetical protein
MAGRGKGSKGTGTGKKVTKKPVLGPKNVDEEEAVEVESTPKKYIFFADRDKEAVYAIPYCEQLEKFFAEFIGGREGYSSQLVTISEEAIEAINELYSDMGNGLNFDITRAIDMSKLLKHCPKWVAAYVRGEEYVKEENGEENGKEDKDENGDEKEDDDEDEKEDGDDDEDEDDEDEDELSDIFVEISIKEFQVDKPSAKKAKIQEEEAIVVE